MSGLMNLWLRVDMICKKRSICSGWSGLGVWRGRSGQVGSRRSEVSGEQCDGCGEFIRRGKRRICVWVIWLTHGSGIDGCRRTEPLLSHKEVLEWHRHNFLCLDWDGLASDWIHALHNFSIWKWSVWKWVGTSDLLRIWNIQAYQEKSSTNRTKYLNQKIEQVGLVQTSEWIKTWAKETQLLVGINGW